MLCHALAMASSMTSPPPFDASHGQDGPFEVDPGGAGQVAQCQVAWLLVFRSFRAMSYLEFG